MVRQRMPLLSSLHGRTNTKEAEPAILFGETSAKGKGAANRRSNRNRTRSFCTFSQAKIRHMWHMLGIAWVSCCRFVLHCCLICRSCSCCFFLMRFPKKSVGLPKTASVCRNFHRCSTVPLILWKASIPLSTTQHVTFTHGIFCVLSRLCAYSAYLNGHAQFICL